MLSQKRQGQIMDAMRECGRAMLMASPKKSEIHLKQGRANFVTDYDVHNQLYLRKAFAEILPEAVFFGEEETGEKRPDTLDKPVFIVDPIDGTTNFMYGYHHSTVSVGYAQSGNMQAGFVYNPYTDEMYHAVRGQGSFHNGERIHALSGGLKDGIAAFGCAGYNEEHTQLLFDMLEKIYPVSPAIRSGGSAAWDIARIGGGCNVCYLEMVLQPWDYAAASVIVEEAGGIITQLDGSPVSLLHASSVLAATPPAHAELLQMVALCRQRIKEE